MISAVVVSLCATCIASYELAHQTQRLFSENVFSQAANLHKVKLWELKHQDLHIIIIYKWNHYYVQIARRQTCYTKCTSLLLHKRNIILNFKRGIASLCVYRRHFDCFYQALIVTSIWLHFLFLLLWVKLDGAFNRHCVPMKLVSQSWCYSTLARDVIHIARVTELHFIFHEPQS